MLYSGILDFDDYTGDFIQVERLIVREDSISFDGIATWDRRVDAKIHLEAVAHKNDVGFTSNPTRPNNRINDQYHPVILSFSRVDVCEDGLEVQGIWRLSGDDLHFSGVLEKVVITR